jgi:UDP-N-acetylglucosamine--N-acetylmuramyl-(pentapeptide) pyrophosphoryl-undecaprenol N-acetylglucosamine transferase
MNIIIAGGGTGGHVYPGIAIARRLKELIPDARIVFVGTAEGIEAKVVPREGFELRFIRAEGMVGYGILRKLRSLLKIPLSFVDSFSILRQIRPDVVLGLGGYSSGAILLSAFLKRIPTMIHEQNSIPGTTNKILGRFVKAIAVTYHESMSFFPAHKTHLTGNPVREEIRHGDRQRGYRVFNLDSRYFTIFVFGGSRGASQINTAVVESLTYLRDYKDKIQFLHQTGERDLEAVRQMYHRYGFKGTIIPFIHEMADAYAVADLVVSRAGATTLAELTACGKPAILIPYPFAASDHQVSNAKKLCEMGAAQMILDDELNGKTLSEHIRYILEDPDVLEEMERVSRSLGGHDATKKVIDVMMGIIDSRFRIQYTGLTP